MDKISVIVPIYNVEKYLAKCIDSIICQTYDNLEIILVDDGSPDSCPSICDDYLKKDNRIKVYHKKNGGLSDARNYGLEHSKSKYVIFIDSDDFIEKEMIEILYKNMIKYNADISMCDFIEEDDFGNIFKTKNFSDTIYEFNKVDSLNELISQNKITNHAWNKLYKKELFNDVRYPINQLMEDINTTYKLFENSNKVVFINTPLYHYIQRGNSILGNVTRKRIIDQDIATKERNTYLIKKYPILNDVILIDNLNTLKTIFRLSYIMNYKDIYNNKSYIREYQKNVKIFNKMKNKYEFDFSTKIFYFCKFIYKQMVLFKKAVKK